MTTIKEDILSYAASAPGFQSYELIQHLHHVRKNVNNANVTTMLKELSAEGGPLRREAIPGINPRRFRYWGSDDAVPGDIKRPRPQTRASGTGGGS